MTGALFAEEDLLPLSALQHLIFCERQCALIHLERQWVENPLTLEGQFLHERAHEGPGESRRDLVLARGVALRSWRLGITGRADVVELHRLAAGAAGGVALPGRKGRFAPRPVEYKRGRPKEHDADRVQLCAQALCLEEMLGVEVLDGALYYGKTRRREEVVFSPELRRTTEDACRRLHRLFATRRTPEAVREPKCDHCSLYPVCRPDVVGRSARRYLQKSLTRALAFSGEVA